MVEWIPQKLTEDIGYEIAKKFHLEKKITPVTKNIARIKDGMADIDYFGVNFEIRFKGNGDKLLIIDIFPHEKNLEGLLEYVRNQIGNEVIFSENGALKFIGHRKEFHKYSERLEYLYSEESDKPDASGKIHKAVSVYYKVKEPLLRVPYDSFRETAFDYAILPIFTWAYKMRSLNILSN